MYRFYNGYTCDGDECDGTVADDCIDNCVVHHWVGSPLRHNTYEYVGDDDCDDLDDDDDGGDGGDGGDVGAYASDDVVAGVPSDKLYARTISGSVYTYAVWR